MVERLHDLGLADPRLLQQHARHGILGTVAVKVGDQMAESLGGEAAGVENGADERLLGRTGVGAPDLVSRA